MTPINILKFSAYYTERRQNIFTIILMEREVIDNQKNYDYIVLYFETKS